jgi:nucleoside phosphorylase
MRWLLAAHEKEIPGFQKFRAGDWQPHAVGVGQFAALARLSAMVAHERPSAVLLVGTAGSADVASVGQQFAVQHFAYPSITGEELPEFLERAFTTQTAIALGGVSAATVLQNHGVSTDLAKFVSNGGYIPPSYPKPIVENMEAASLAQLCRTLQIPFTALIAVTNTIGPDARNQWKQNFRQAGEQLAKTLQQIVC